MCGADTTTASMNALGIDIGGTSIKLALLRDGQIEWTRKSAPFTRPSTQQLVDAISQTTAPNLPPLNAVGLCCPGLLDRAHRTIKRSEEHTSELQSQFHLVCRLLLE